AVVGDVELHAPAEVDAEAERAPPCAGMPDDVSARFAHDDTRDLVGLSRRGPIDNARRDLDRDVDSRAAEQRCCFGDLTLGSEWLGVMTDRTQVGHCTLGAEPYNI